MGDCFEAITSPSTELVQLTAKSTELATVAGPSTELAELKGSGDVPCPGVGGTGTTFTLPAAGVVSGGPALDYTLTPFELATVAVASSGPPLGINVLTDFALPAAGVSIGGPPLGYTLSPFELSADRVVVRAPDLASFDFSDFELPQQGSRTVVRAPDVEFSLSSFELPADFVVVFGPPLNFLDPVGLMGFIDVTEPPPPFLALKRDNSNPSDNRARLQDMVSNATSPLLFREGEYAIDDTIVSSKSAVPWFVGAGVAGQYQAGTVIQTAMAKIMWHGQAAKNDRPMFHQRGEGWNFHNMTLFGKISQAAPSTDRAACALQIGGIPGDPVNAGKSMNGYLTVEECDVGIQAGHTSQDKGGDNVVFQMLNIENCRIGFQMINSQNLGFDFGFLRVRGVEEVAINVLSGGRVTVHSGVNISNNIIWLRLNPAAGTGGIGQNTGSFNMSHIGQDGNAQNCVWLDDRMREDGSGGSHFVRFKSMSFLGTADVGDVENHVRISGSGILTLTECFNTFRFNSRVFLDGTGSTPRVRAALHMCDGDLANAANLFTGSDGYVVFATTSFQAIDPGIRESDPSVSSNGAATGTAAWNALPIITAYGGPGALA